METTWFLFPALLVAIQVLGVRGHGRLIEPPSRASMWRFGFNTMRDYNDNEGFCGGFTRQWAQNGGKCGICGDPYDAPHPRAHELGGMYGTGEIVRTFLQGDAIEVKVDITANHKGYFEFKLCPVQFTEATQAELDKCVLPMADGSGDRVYINSSKMIHTAQLRLPDNLTCDHCVFQWTYIAANNWGICEDGQGKVGCGPQEHFRACADIRINPRSGGFNKTTGLSTAGNSINGGVQQSIQTDHSNQVNIISGHSVNRPGGIHGGYGNIDGKYGINKDQFTIHSGQGFKGGYIKYLGDMYPTESGIQSGQQGVKGLANIPSDQVHSGGPYDQSQVNGNTGTTGQGQVNGYTGTSGQSQVNGHKGTSGHSQVNGYTGTSGHSQVNGYTGTAGHSQVNGYTGTAGHSQVNRYTGTSGQGQVNGYTGTSGQGQVNGYTGTSGQGQVNGYTGTSGQSEINGYTGTSGQGQINGYTGTSGQSQVNGYTGSLGQTQANGYTGALDQTQINGHTGTSGQGQVNGYRETSGQGQVNGYTGTSGQSQVNGYTGTLGQTQINGHTGTSGQGLVNGYTGTSGQGQVNGYTGTSGQGQINGHTGTSGQSQVDGYTGTSGQGQFNGYTGMSGQGQVNGYTGTSGQSQVNGYTGTQGQTVYFEVSQTNSSGAGISSGQSENKNPPKYIPPAGGSDTAIDNHEFDDEYGKTTTKRTPLVVTVNPFKRPITAPPLPTQPIHPVNPAHPVPPDSGTKYGRCEPVGIWITLPGMTDWCVLNCIKATTKFCPPTHCRCH